jgi:hypothetical protein
MYLLKFTKSVSAVSVCSLLLFCTINFSVSNAQSARKQIPAKSDWQARLKRIYLFTDINDAQNSNISYTSQGRFSIHRYVDNSVIFTGQKINKADISTDLANSLLHIIDAANVSDPVEKENIPAALAEFELPQKNFSVFPNPIDNSQREITLDFNEFDEGKEIQMSLFDLQGRVIGQQKFTLKDKRHTVAIPQLSSGQYFVRINENNNQYAKKLLVR